MTFAELPVGTWFYLYKDSKTKYIKIGRKYAVAPPRATRWTITPDSTVQKTDPPKEIPQ